MPLWPGTQQPKDKETHLHKGMAQASTADLERLAERIDVTAGALSQLERGDTGYTQPMLEALVEALSCEPADP